MRRARERELLKQGDTEILSREELAMQQEQIKRESVSQAVNLYSLVAMTVLRDKLGFGQKRITRFNDDVQNVLDSINEGYVTKEDLREMLLEEVKIRV